MSTTFRFAGVSRIKGKLKVRFSDRDVYAKALIKADNTDVEIVDLGAPMTREQAVKYLLDTDFAKGNTEVLDVLQAAAGKRAEKAELEAARARGEVKRGRKPKAKLIEVPAETATAEPDAVAAPAELEDAPF